MEGHPFFETSRGLEYLFGYCYRDDTGVVRYDAVWGRDREGERRAFERFVDWLVERRRRHPGMHVYHYAHYERTALTRLMGQHGTRETEIDDLLRAEVLVDLYRVTKQALRASVESYSIKAIEKLYGFVAHRRRRRRRRVDRPLRGVGRDRRRRRSSRRSSATTRRTAARRTRSTSGCSGSARPACRGATRRSSARARRSSSSATRSGRRSRSGCSPVPRRARRDACSGTSSTTTSARRARSGGPGSAGRSSTTTSSSPTGRRSAGSRGTAGRRRSTGRATRIASRSPSRSTSSRRRGPTRTRGSAFGWRSTTTTAS